MNWWEYSLIALLCLVIFCFLLWCCPGYNKFGMLLNRTGGSKVKNANIRDYSRGTVLYEEYDVNSNKIIGRLMIPHAIIDGGNSTGTSIIGRKLVRQARENYKAPTSADAGVGDETTQLYQSGLDAGVGDETTQLYQSGLDGGSRQRSNTDDIPNDYVTSYLTFYGYNWRHKLITRKNKHLGTCQVNDGAPTDDGKTLNVSFDAMQQAGVISHSSSNTYTFSPEYSTSTVIEGATSKEEIKSLLKTCENVQDFYKSQHTQSILASKYDAVLTMFEKENHNE